MDLPVPTTVKPMLAKPVTRVPAPGTVAGGLLYEPKWDGFRCILFRDGDEVELGSRRGRPLTRYFPEVVDGARNQLPDRVVLDGEIVIFGGDRLDFEALLNRVHPADSRVRKLAAETPASFIAFDLLALGDTSLMDVGFTERRTRLEAALYGVGPPVFLTPATGDHGLAERWFQVFEGAGLDGVVAKPRTLGYAQDQRVMFKAKHERTADCVVGGFRWHRVGGREQRAVGSLLLGLYDGDAVLQHVGVAGAFSQVRRRELVETLAPYRQATGEEHPWLGGEDMAESESTDRVPGAQTRWNAQRDLAWIPVRPQLVCEVRYDHMEGTRFRHTTHFVRWRPDRLPESCTYAQLEVPVRFQLAEVLASGQPERPPGARPA